MKKFRKRLLIKHRAARERRQWKRFFASMGAVSAGVAVMLGHARIQQINASTLPAKEKALAMIAEYESTVSSAAKSYGVFCNLGGVQ